MVIEGMRTVDQGIGFSETPDSFDFMNMVTFKRICIDGKKVSKHRRAFPISGDQEIEPLFKGGAKGDPLLQVGTSHHVQQGRD